MKRPKCTIYLKIIAIFVMVSCQPQQDAPDEERKKEVSGALLGLANGLLDSWQPPFDPETALRHFTHSDDFFLTLDAGAYITDYSEWDSVVNAAMQKQKENYKSYNHEIIDYKVNVLGDNHGVITYNYTTDLITMDGKAFKGGGIATFLGKTENGKWVIVHYHGSHKKMTEVEE